ncbi:MAG: hypothetical protein ACLSFT_09590 [Ruminococcus callidus]
MGGRLWFRTVSWYKPEDLIGKKIVLWQTQPAKLCGVESCDDLCGRYAQR